MKVKVKYFVKPSSLGYPRIKFEELWHRKCMGRPFMKKDWSGAPAKRVYECARCHREFFIGQVDMWLDADKYFRYTKYEEIDTAKLEPVEKLVDASQGKVAYTTLRPMTDKELLKYYGYNNYEVLDDKPKIDLAQADVDTLIDNLNKYFKVP